MSFSSSCTASRPRLESTMPSRFQCWICDRGRVERASRIGRSRDSFSPASTFPTKGRGRIRPGPDREPVLRARSRGESAAACHEASARRALQTELNASGCEAFVRKMATRESCARAPGGIVARCTGTRLRFPDRKRLVPTVFAEPGFFHPDTGDPPSSFLGL